MHPVTGVSARRINTHYRLLWNWDQVDQRFWWWGIFGENLNGSFDTDGFSFWDYIAMYMNHEAEYHHTEFADEMSEAGVRFWYARVNAKPPLATPGVYGFVDWWASFSQSSSVEAKSMILPAEIKGVKRDEYRAFITAAQNFKNPPPDWQNGLRQDRPYGWGNISAYKLYTHNSKMADMLYANRKNYPIIFGYIPDITGKHNPMYIPSGCAVKNCIDNSDAHRKTAWDPTICNWLLTPTPGSRQEADNMEKNKPSFGILTTLCAVFMLGCQPAAGIAVATASPQALLPTPTFVAMPTVTITSGAALPWRRECIGMSTSLDAAPAGVVVIQDQGSGDISLLNLQTGDRKTFGHDAAGMMAISPDRRQLAYTYFLEGPLEIVDGNGAPVASRTLPKGWVGVVRWIDMDTLLMEKFAQQSDYYQNASSIIYHFKTGEQKEMSSNYPGIDLTTKFPWGNYSFTRAVYDPSFSRVVYPGLVLWDLDNNRSIVELHQGLEYTLGSEPQWSQDGSFFIAAVAPQAESYGTPYKNATDNLPYQGGYELWRVSRDGAVKRLTTLTAQHYAGEEAFSLSPDEKRIAFWLVPNYDFTPVTQAPKSLAILDMESGKITDLCIPGGESSLAPVWSPDGKYLAVSRYTADASVDESILPDVLLIDLERKQAARIAKNSVVNGWMVK